MCEKLDLLSKWKRRRGGWKVWDHMIPAEIRAMDVLRLGRKSILERLKPVALKFAEENLASIEDSMSSWEFELVASSLRTNLVKGGTNHKWTTFDDHSQSTVNTVVPSTFIMIIDIVPTPANYQDSKYYLIPMLAIAIHGFYAEV